MLESLARRAVGGLLRLVSDRRPKTNPVEPETEAPPPSKRRYDPKEHNTHYQVGAGVVQLLLEHGGPKTVKDLVQLSGEDFAQSTIRQTCKILVTDGLLKQVDDYPASFVIVNEDAARAFVQAVSLFRSPADGVS
jgi:hypothetical protein